MIARNLILALILIACLPVMASPPASLVADQPQRTQKTVKQKQQEQARKQNKSRSQSNADKPQHKPVNQRQKGDKKPKEPDLL